MEKKKSDKMRIENTTQNTFMYSIDGFNSKTFSSNKLHKKVFDCGKNRESNDPIANRFKGKSYKRESSIRNQHESQIAFS